MDRDFLDANILFSAAYRTTSTLNRLWTLADVALVTSTYALEEARRNLATTEHQARLETLMNAVEILSVDQGELSDEWVLPEKDLPIALAAVAGKCQYLITGDRSHFGPLMGRTIQGVTVRTPREFLAHR